MIVEYIGLWWGRAHGGHVKVLRVVVLYVVFAATRSDEISLGESTGRKAKWSGDRDH